MKYVGHDCVTQAPPFRCGECYGCLGNNGVVLILWGRDVYQAPETSISPNIEAKLLCYMKKARSAPSNDRCLQESLGEMYKSIDSFLKKNAIKLVETKEFDTNSVSKIYVMYG